MCNKWYWYCQRSYSESFWIGDYYENQIYSQYITNIEDNTGKDNINIIRLQDEDGNTGENTDFKEIYSDGEITSFPSGVVITGNSAYEQYTYVDGIALKYTDTINNIADSLKGMSEV